MLRQRTRTLQAAAALVDAAAVATAFFAAYFGAGVLPEHLCGPGKPFGPHWTPLFILPFSEYLWVLWVSIPMWWVLFALFGCYDFSPIESRRDSLRRMAGPLGAGAMAIAAVVFFAKELEFARRVIGSFLLGTVTLLAAGRFFFLTAAGKAHRRAGPLRRILVVGAGDAAREFAAHIERRGWGLHLAGFVSPEAARPTDSAFLGNVDALAQLLDGGNIDDVVLVDAANDLELAQKVIRLCEEVGVAIHIPSPFFRARLSKPHVETFSGVPMLTFVTRPYNPIALGIKRAADLVGSALLLVISAIPMAAIAACIKLTSPGPAIFRQRRSGLYGRPFTMYKFRSMVRDAESMRPDLETANVMDGPVFKMADDPRITAFGRFLRKYSLDELPQLWNVFKGEMSLIGPRPPIPAEVEKYERWQRRRLSMRPGLTCIWQVSDRNKATFERWMEYDLRYIDNWSLWLDLKVALKTIPAIIKGTGL